MDRNTGRVEDVGIDHGGGDVVVSEEFLDGADVGTTLEEVGGETVAESVRGGVFGETNFLNGGFH